MCIQQILAHTVHVGIIYSYRSKLDLHGHRTITKVFHRLDY